MKTSVILCLLFALAAHCATLPPSADFNVTDFVGEWNVAGLFATVPLNTAFYSCPTFTVTLGTLSRLSLTLSFIDIVHSTTIQQTTTVIPSPLNKANLINAQAPSAANNYVVIYYNTSEGQAIILNNALTIGVVLSRAENPQYNNFQAQASALLESLTVPLSNVTFFYNRNCDAQNTHPLQNLNLPQMMGVYYGNAIYTNVPNLQGVECFSLSVSPASNLVNVTVNLNMVNGKDFLFNQLYLPQPGNTAVLINTQIMNVSPLVVIFQDATTNTYAVASADGNRGYVFSPQPTINSNLVSEVSQAFVQNGMAVSNTTFYVLNTTCSTEQLIDNIIV